VLRWKVRCCGQLSQGQRRILTYKFSFRFMHLHPNQGLTLGCFGARFGSPLGAGFGAVLGAGPGGFSAVRRECSASALPLASVSFFGRVGHGGVVATAGIPRHLRSASLGRGRSACCARVVALLCPLSVGGRVGDSRRFLGGRSARQRPSSRGGADSIASLASGGDCRAPRFARVATSAPKGQGRQARDRGVPRRFSAVSRPVRPDCCLHGRSDSTAHVVDLS
jgi:hypothetical protein